LTTAEDVAKWNKLKPVPVDFTKLRENTDNTILKQTVACAGGGCEVI
jgi:ribonucleoside-diphosphate reductase alpha chain